MASKAKDNFTNSVLNLHFLRVKMKKFFKESLE